MKFLTRKLVTHEDLNPRGYLHGGQLLKWVDEVITISTEEAKERALRLAKENGLFVGVSAGANVLASERWIEQNNPDGVVVTILCDRGERYFSLYK